MADNEDLLDYEDEEATEQVAVEGAGDAPAKKEVKGTYVSIHSSGFRDFLLKPEILRSIVDCGFEHPSEGNILFIWREYSQNLETIVPFHNYLEVELLLRGKQTHYYRAWQWIAAVLFQNSDTWTFKLVINE